MIWFLLFVALVYFFTGVFLAVGFLRDPRAKHVPWFKLGTLALYVLVCGPAIVLAMMIREAAR